VNAALAGGSQWRLDFTGIPQIFIKKWL